MIGPSRGYGNWGQYDALRPMLKITSTRGARSKNTLIKILIIGHRDWLSSLILSFLVLFIIIRLFIIVTVEVVIIFINLSEQGTNKLNSQLASSRESNPGHVGRMRVLAVERQQFLLNYNPQREGDFK